MCVFCEVLFSSELWIVCRPRSREKSERMYPRKLSKMPSICRINNLKVSETHEYFSDDIISLHKVSSDILRIRTSPETLTRISRIRTIVPHYPIRLLWYNESILTDRERNKSLILIHHGEIRLSNLYKIWGSLRSDPDFSILDPYRISWYPYDPLDIIFSRSIDMRSKDDNISSIGRTDFERDFLQSSRKKRIKPLE